MTVLPYVFIVIGFSLVMWHKPIAQWLYNQHRSLFKTIFSWLINVDAPWFRKAYDLAMLGMGIMFFIVAYFTYFGPITR
jgi:hypothetical protein